MLFSSIASNLEGLVDVEVMADNPVFDYQKDSRGLGVANL